MNADEEYKKLIAGLPKITPPKGGSDDVKAQELLQKANDLPIYAGAEDDGLNESVESEKRQIRKEARRYCAHVWKTTVKRDMTADARCRVVRMIECEKCGMAHRDVAEESI